MMVVVPTWTKHKEMVRTKKLIQIYLYDILDCDNGIVRNDKRLYYCVLFLIRYCFVRFCIRISKTVDKN